MFLTKSSLFLSFFSKIKLFKHLFSNSNCWIWALYLWTRSVKDLKVRSISCSLCFFLIRKRAEAAVLRFFLSISTPSESGDSVLGDEDEDVVLDGETSACLGAIGKALRLKSCSLDSDLMNCDRKSSGTREESSMVPICCWNSACKDALSDVWNCEVLYKVSKSKKLGSMNWSRPAASPK
ncbi:hypothetical protein WICPIJ_002679 [Wickerhamomyces pijperi]|uniref:Uncharacterized protein n=1 Tax=Wickerhamomyces pijperi TaxID=599730 RepID=A0A9P8Q966_WICPI|nr:hypothetical protein WICPIJ_002679 [Wickerhamomyces pijperi]